MAAKRLLVAATYYLPYISGLTVFLQRLATALPAWGWEAEVLTCRHAPGLAGEEVREGVRVRRLSPWLRVSKGVVMPTLPWHFLRRAREADLVLLLLPQADAAPLAWLAKRLAKPLLVIYLCDVTLTGGFFSQLVQRALERSHRWALAQADAVVALSQDYARTSPLLSAFARKLHLIPPPVPLLAADPQQVTRLRQRWHLQAGQPVVGWVGRLSREKGLHVLAQAMPTVWQAIPQARVLCAGPVAEVAGEASYRRFLLPQVAPLGQRWVFTGVLAEEELPAFYACCSVLAFPSVNRTEAFGMVQVEAMGVGTPVVASDLPGVREPVALTGMGLLVPPADPKALAQALLAVLRQPARFQGRRETLGVFSPHRVAERYAELFARLLMPAAGDAPVGALK